MNFEQAKNEVEFQKNQTNINRSLVTRSSSLQSELELLPVTTLEEHEIAKVKLSGIQEFKKEVNNFFDPNIKSAHDLHKSLVAQKKSIVEPIEAKELPLKKKMKTFQEAQKKIHEEAIATAKAEEDRLRKLAEDEQIQKGLDMLDRGVKAEVAEIIADYKPYIPPVPVDAPDLPKFDKRQFKDNWKFKVVDESKIPREFLCADEKKIGQMVRAMKDKAKIETMIPGIEAYIESF